MHGKKLRNYVENMRKVVRVLHQIVRYAILAR